MTTAEDPLDTLRALFPHLSTPTLQKYLTASSFNLERAFAAIERGALDSDTSRPAKRKRTRGGSEGLSAWLGAKGGRRSGEAAEVVVLSSDSDEEEEKKPSISPSSASQKPLKSAYDALRPPPTASLPQNEQTTQQSHVNLPPLELTSPQMIAEHTRGLVTLVENALPPELAARLFVRMVEESLGEGEGEFRQPNKWWLVDREVTSPHTSSFYREVPEKLKTEQGYDAAAFDEAAQYWYNGAKRTSRPFTPEMDLARELVREFVRTLMSSRYRERHPLEWQGEWEPNVAAANCYRGKNESVGWHSDVLQYLGPMPTIASLTLGVGRPFRLRPFLPSSSSSSSSFASSSATTTSSSSARPTAPSPSPAASPSTLTPPTLRTLSLHLPHNSLLIMHAGVQEVFKHCVPPVGGGMDVFALRKGLLRPGKDTGEGEGGGGWSEEKVKELEGRKWRERINMTFRHYRPDFAPRTPTSPASYAGTPLCACGVPCTLRPDGKGQQKAQEEKAEERARYGAPEMLYFWVCNAGAQNEGKGCGHWRVMDMKREGRGRWFRAAERGDPGESGGSGAAPAEEERRQKQA
ncbi:hypothetical protein JCM10213v2_005171 [Rhodosporidiobolus nylandii]